MTGGSPSAKPPDDLHGVRLQLQRAVRTTALTIPAVGTDNYGGLCRIYKAEGGRACEHLHERRGPEDIPAHESAEAPRTTRRTAWRR